MTLVGMRTSPAICIYTPWPIISLSCLLLNCPCMMSQNNPIIACTLHDNAQHSLFKVQKTLEGFLEHYSGEFIDISCISWLASIKSSRVCVMKFPFLGSRLHLVIVSDKSSRGEVADLIARILTRWKSWQRLWSRVSGGWQWEPSWGQGGGGGEGGRCLSFDFHLSTLSRLLR